MSRKAAPSTPNAQGMSGLASRSLIPHYTFPFQLLKLGDVYVCGLMYFPKHTFPLQAFRSSLSKGLWWRMGVG